MLLGAMASFHLSTMDTVWIQTSTGEKGINRPTAQEPRIDTLSHPEKVGYAVFGVILLTGTLCGLIVLIKPKH